MPTIITTGHGAIDKIRVDGSVDAMGCPPNSLFRNALPSWRQYRGRSYGVGAWDRGVMVSEFGRAYTLGLKTPTVAPTLAAGAAGAINSGGSIAYYALVHKKYNLTMDESALSPPSATVVPVNKKLELTAVPASFPDDLKATHWRYYRSDNGGIPKMVADIAIGTTTYSDNTTTLALPDVDADLINRGPVPTGVRYNEVYSEMMFYAGGPHKDRVYYSKIGEPQSVGENSFLATREGESVVGLHINRDQLLVGCPGCFYSIQTRGFDNNGLPRLVIEKISRTVGLLSHHAMVDIHGRLWFPSREGVYIYDGAFKLVSREIWHLWRQEYEATAEAFHQMQAAHDEFRKIYKLLYRKASTATIQSRYFTGNYANFEPTVATEGEGQPAWGMDFRARRDSSLGLISFGDGDARLATGSCDGKVRFENELDDADDDGDAYQKALTIQTGCNFTGIPAGGDEEDGYTFTSCWVFAESEFNAWELRLVGGDEQAVHGASAGAGLDNISLWQVFDVAASLVSGSVAKTVHFFSPEKVSGRGLVFQVYATSPVRMSFRGFGVNRGPGPATRPGPAVDIVAYNQSVSVAHDTPKSITLTAASSIDPSFFEYAIVDEPLNGSLDTSNLPVVIYTPTGGYSGPDSFTFNVRGGTSLSNTATISLTVA